MKHLYLAGPYTKPDPIINTNAAINVATILLDRQLWVPHVPHLTLLWHMVTPRPIDYWYNLDIEHMRKCDAFCRLPGESTGADREQDIASQFELEWVPFMSLPPAAVRAWIDRDVYVADPA
jgi:hypothetical protein